VALCHLAQRRSADEFLSLTQRSDRQPGFFSAFTVQREEDEVAPPLLS